MYAVMKWPHNFGMLNLHSPEENSLSALLHDCTGKTNLTHDFNGNEFILDTLSLHRYEYFVFG